MGASCSEWVGECARVAANGGECSEWRLANGGECSEWVANGGELQRMANGGELQRMANGSTTSSLFFLIM